MKLLRYGPKGSEKPGLLDAEGKIRDLSGHVADINGATVSPEGLQRLAGIDPDILPIVEGSPRYGMPVGNVGKFLAIGLNFADHAKEAGLEPPPEPIFFTKAISCLNGPNDDVMIPKDALKTDWEVELGVVIGKRARYVEQAEALEEMGVQLDAVLSFTVDADVVVERMLARGRADDNEDVIRNRLSVYATETAPLLEHYGSEVTSIDAVGEVHEVHRRVLASLGVDADAPGE